MEAAGGGLEINYRILRHRCYCAVLMRVGYKNYADNVVRYFVNQAASSGIDIFRVFDSLNWVENMRLSMDSVMEAGKVCEGTICYTGNVADAKSDKYSVKLLFKNREGIGSCRSACPRNKRYGGTLCLPHSASMLISALKQEIGIPIHFHTHDTSGDSSSERACSGRCWRRCCRLGNGFYEWANQST